MAGPGGVLVGRGYVVIRPEFAGDWDRNVGAHTSRSGAAGGRSWSGAFSKAAGAGLSGLGTVIKSSLAGSALAATAVGIGQIGAAAVAASAVAAPALSAIGTAGAAIGVGFKGIGKAFKAFDSAASDAKAAASATRAVESAQRSLARAQQAVGEARVSAARRVRDAERTVVDAQRDATRAQEDSIDAQRAAIDVQNELTAARRDATRQLEDYKLRLADAAIDQEEAAQRVLDAEQDLADARKSNDKDAIAKADLALRRAKLGVQQQAQDHKRLREEEAAATKAGVEGSEQVLAAQERIADAKDRAKDASERAAEADRNVIEAQHGVAEAQVDGAKQIAAAQESVADAARALADAQSAAASQVSKVNEALAKLTPNAREFVETVKDLGPAWGEVRKATQESLFKGVAGSFRSMSEQIIPDLKSGLSGAASQISLMWRNWMDGVKELSQDGTLRRFFDSNTKILGNFVKLPEQMTKSWVQLSIAATPALDRLTQKFADASTRWSDRLADSFESGRLEKKISAAFDSFKVLKEPLADIGTIFKNFFGAMVGPGGEILGFLGEFFDELARITSLPKVKQALTDIFGAFASITETVMKALTPLVEHGLPLLATGLEWIARALPPVVDWLGRFAAVAVEKIGSGIGAAAQGTRDFFDAFKSGGDVGTQASAMERMGAASRSFSDKASGYARSFFDAFRDGELKSKWFVSKPGLDGVFDRLGAATKGAADLIRQQIFPAVLELGRGLQSFLTPIVEAFSRIWTEHVQHVLERVATVISRALVPIFKALGEFIRSRVSPALEELGGKFAGLLDKLRPVISFIDSLVTFVFKIGSAVAGFLIPILIRWAGPVFTLLVNAIGFVIDVIGFAVDAVTWLGRSVMWLWDEAIKPAFEGIGKAAKWLWEEAIKPVFGAISESFRGWGLMATWLWNEALKPAFEGIGAGLTWLWDHTIHPIVGWITDSFRGWGLIAQWLWDEAIKPTFDKIAGAATWLWNEGIKPPFASIRGAFGDMGQWAKDTYFTVADWFGKVGTKIGEVTDGFVGAFANAKDLIGQIWSGVMDKVASPINWIIDKVYGGLKFVWNTVADKVGLGGLKLGDVPRIEAPPAVGGAQRLRAYAEGGIYPGYTPGRDIGVAAVSGGEAIMRPEWTRQVGPGYVRAANAAAVSGGQAGVARFHAANGVPYAGAFALGGIVDDALDWAKGLARGAAAKGLEIGLKPVKGIIGKAPDHPDWARIGKQVPLKWIDAMIEKIRGEDTKWASAGSISGLAWANSQAGKPYQWGGSGDPSWDCSGLMAAISEVIRGRAPRRLWTTFDFKGPTAPEGWQQNLEAPFRIGVTNAGVGHMAGTILGTNVESRSGDGVVVGPRARGWNHPMFVDHYGFAPAGPSASGAPSGTLAAWIGAALSATGTPPPGSLGAWMSGMSTLVGRESGGNPRAINTTDSNARAGNASRGLAQVIPTTFAAYHQPGTSWDIFDPVANLSASVRYIKAVYGDISNVQQANPQRSRKGYDSGGWLPPGATTAVNATGVPEAVLTGSQWNVMYTNALQAAAPRRDISSVHVYVGDREITDIVRVELRDFAGALGGALDDGRG